MSAEEEQRPPSYIAALRKDEPAPQPEPEKFEPSGDLLGGVPVRTEVTPPAPSTPQQVATTLGVLDKAIETERNVELEFNQVVDKVQIPEIAAVLDEISKQALVNQQRLNEIRKLASSEEKALTSEPVDLNTCFNKAMGMARTVYGAYERLTVDRSKEALAEIPPDQREGEVTSLTKRAKDTLKAVRNDVRDTPCLLIRDKVAKLGQIDHALELIDAGAVDIAAEVIRGF